MVICGNQSKPLVINTDVPVVTNYHYYVTFEDGKLHFLCGMWADTDILYIQFIGKKLEKNTDCVHALQLTKKLEGFFGKVSSRTTKYPASVLHFKDSSNHLLFLQLLFSQSSLIIEFD